MSSTQTTTSTDDISTHPTKINIHPVALLSILDHYLRRTPSQDRVIGTLLGTRSPDTGVVTVTGSFGVLHSETREVVGGEYEDEQTGQEARELVAVDEEYAKSMWELTRKAGVAGTIVGWYSTGSNLNTNSALLQNFYSQETVPHQAIHVSLNTGLQQGEKAGVKAYIGSPVGVNPKPENCVFVPVPVELKFNEPERSGINLLTSTLAAPSNTTTQPSIDLVVLEQSLHTLSSMLDNVLDYVGSVLRGEREGDKAVGRYLMDTIGAGAEELGGGFGRSLQDTLMVSYLANLIRSQAEVASRLALVTAP